MVADTQRNDEARYHLLETVRQYASDKLLEFGEEEDRPAYIGLANTLIAPFTFLAPVLGGWLADTSADKPGSNEVKGSVEIHLWDLAADPPTMKTLVQGMDYVIDHLVFSPDGTLLAGLSRLAVWWRRLGIRHERIKPAHPEQNDVKSWSSFRTNGNVSAN